jgi:hypothetical protein
VVLDAQMQAALEAEAAAELWRRGDLTYLLDTTQLALLDQMNATSGRFVLECARRLGKTYLLCCVATMVCLGKRRARVVYAGPTLKDVAEFILPTLEAIAEDAPTELRPRYDSQKGHFVFPNGSYIHLFGCDDRRKANRGRGPGADLAIVDEAGFISILKYVLKSVLRPQTLGRKGARTLIASTPAEEPDHDFTAVAEQAEKNLTYARRTIHDNPRLSTQEIEEFIAEDARDEGLTPEEYALSDTFRREYLAERVTNKLLIAVPEWEEARARCLIDWPRPEYFDGLTMLDMGGAHPHAVALGYYDFKAAKFVIEYELLLRDGENTSELAANIKELEREAWGTTRHDGSLRGAKETISLPGFHAPDWLVALATKQAPEQPFLRVSDTDTQMITDLRQLSGITFIPTAKDNKQAQVNALRILIKEDRFRVHPRCIHMDRHLRTTIWQDEKRKKFKVKHGEHGDLVDCAVYGLRNLPLHRNPYPLGWEARPGERPTVRALLEAEEKKPANALMRALMGDTPLSRKVLGGTRR